MADPKLEDIRGREFPVARRGYEREAVDAFRDEMADLVGSLVDRVRSFEGKLDQLGIDDVPLLAEELRRIGAGISSILEAARKSATEMRKRAEEDAAAKRAAADRETETLRTTTQHDVERLRGQAWEQGTAMLEQVVVEVEALVAAARQDALFIRADAERESLRMTGEARRESEAELRTARNEAERLLREARAESEHIIESARRSVEAAQERTRALETRRSELMTEVDKAQRSLDRLGVEMEARRSAAAPSPESDTTGPPEADAGRERSTWPRDPSVRVVPGSRVVAPVPVDADELVAEVERLRSGAPDAEPATREVAPSIVSGVRADEPEDSAATGPLEEVPADEADAAPRTDEWPIGRFEEAEPRPIGEAADGMHDDAELTGRPAENQQASVQPRASRPEQGAADDDTGVTPDDRSGTTVGVRESGAAEAPARPAPPGNKAAREVEPEIAPLDSLFALLRTDAPEEEDAEPGERPPSEAAAPEVKDTVDTSDVAAGAQPSLERAGPAVAVRTATDLRDRLLLPIENIALRDIKRRLLDAQNEALFQLRTEAPAWSPDAAIGAAPFAAVPALVDQSFAAGHHAAGELTGLDPPRPGSPPSDGPWQDLGQVFAAGVEDAHRRAVEHDAGEREIAAAVSRVFRTWRTDEAERRVRALAYRAYHDGLLNGLAQLGTTRVMAVADGRRCAECPASMNASWDPAIGPPPGTVLPPAHEDCATTIVPAL